MTRETIFRIQDAQGRGPWRPGFSGCWVVERPDHENLLPWYVEMGRIDKLVSPGQYMGCGCSSVEQLKRWFTEPEYRALIGHGYSAVKMEGEIIGRSDIQVVFQRRKPLAKNVSAFELY